jgi:hypothetical protein
MWCLNLLSLCLWCLLICNGPSFAVAEEHSAEQPKPPATREKLEASPSPTVTTIPELDEFLIIPLRVYRLKSTDLPAANCELTDQDVRRIVGKVNRVWAYGGIYFGLESILEETAATARLLRLPEKSQPMAESVNKELPQESEKDPAKDKAQPSDKEALKPRGESREQLLDSRLYKALIPPRTRDFVGFRVYYIHQFDVNGIYYGNREAMVKETARLRQVPGGIDEPLPRVTSHELGHGLTLPHRQDNTNLMASGTTGTTFNEAEIAQARTAAKKLSFAISYTDLEKPDTKRPDAAQKQRAEWAEELRALVKELNK